MARYENAAKCVASGPGWWPEAGNMIYLMLRILALYNNISISIYTYIYIYVHRLDIIYCIQHMHQQPPKTPFPLTFPIPPHPPCLNALISRKNKVETSASSNNPYDHQHYLLLAFTCHESLHSILIKVITRLSQHENEKLKSPGCKLGVRQHRSGSWWLSITRNKTRIHTPDWFQLVKNHGIPTYTTKNPTSFSAWRLGVSISCAMEYITYITYSCRHVSKKSWRVPHKNTSSAASKWKS